MNTPYLLPRYSFAADPLPALVPIAFSPLCVPMSPLKLQAFGKHRQPPEGPLNLLIRGLEHILAQCGLRDTSSIFFGGGAQALFSDFGGPTLVLVGQLTSPTLRGSLITQQGVVNPVAFYSARHAQQSLPW